MEEKIAQIQKQLDKIMDNELVHIKDDITEIHKTVSNLDTKIEKICVDVSWLKKFFWIVASSSIGGLIAGVLGLILNR